jgi:hypothetical protein
MEISLEVYSHRSSDALGESYQVSGPVRGKGRERIGDPTLLPQVLQPLTQPMRQMMIPHLDDGSVASGAPA